VGDDIQGIPRGLPTLDHTDLSGHIFLADSHGKMEEHQLIHTWPLGQQKTPPLTGGLFILSYRITTQGRGDHENNT